MRNVSVALTACALLLAGAAHVNAQFRDVQSITPYPASGNLSYDVSIDLQSATLHRVSLNGQPEWIAGGVEKTPASDVRLVVSTTDGRFHDVRFDSSGRFNVVSLGRRATARVPALVREGDGRLRLFTSQEYGDIRESHPVRFGDPPGVVRVSQAGVARWAPDGDEPRSIYGTALSDGIVTVAAGGLIALPVLPSARYPHGILGDTMEPREFHLFRRPNRYWRRIAAPVGSVFETLLGTFADTDDDGEDELLLTVSNPETGARFVLHDFADGRRIAGPPNGRGFRWKHLIGAGAIGPEGRVEVVGVSTPHIGGVLEFYTDKGDSLELVHTRRGFSSHRIGSRNLAMAAIGDFNADGTPDVVLPSQQRNSLHVIQRHAQGSREVARLELPAPISTNLFVVVDGRPALVFGIADGTIFVITDSGA